MLTRKLCAFCWALILFQASIAAASPDEKRIGFTIPAAPWILTFPAGDFVVERRQIKPDGRNGYFLMADETTHMTLSFFIEPAINCKNSKACRDMVWKTGNPTWVNPKNLVLSEIDNVSVFEFLLPEFQGQPVQQQNMYAEFVVDGFWVDFHLSKVLYKPEEHEIFERLIKSIKFEPKQ